MQPFHVALFCCFMLTEASSSLCTGAELLPVCLRKGKEAAGWHLWSWQWWDYKEITLPITNVQNYHIPLGVFLFCHTVYIQSVTAVLLWNLSDSQPLTSILLRQVFSLTAWHSLAYNINSCYSWTWCSWRSDVFDSLNLAAFQMSECLSCLTILCL